MRPAPPRRPRGRPTGWSTSRSTSASRPRRPGWHAVIDGPASTSSAPIRDATTRPRRIAAAPRRATGRGAAHRRRRRGVHAARPGPALAAPGGRASRSSPSRRPRCSGRRSPPAAGDPRPRRRLPARPGAGPRRRRPGHDRQPDQPDRRPAPARPCSASLVRAGCVVVDEAFMDAVPGEPESLIGGDMRGLVVLRWLTKTWGLPGLRAGYAVGDAGDHRGPGRPSSRPGRCRPRPLAAIVACLSDQGPRRWPTAAAEEIAGTGRCWSTGWTACGLAAGRRAAATLRAGRHGPIRASPARLAARPAARRRASPSAAARPSPVWARTGSGSPSAYRGDHRPPRRGSRPGL